MEGKPTTPSANKLAKFTCGFTKDKITLQVPEAFHHTDKLKFMKLNCSKALKGAELTMELTAKKNLMILFGHGENVR